jgi:hypothetical protein
MLRSFLFTPILTLALLGAGSSPALAQSESVSLERYGKRLTTTEIASYRASPATENDVRSVSFPAQSYLHLLAQPGVAGIVAEFSVDPASGGNTLMMYGVDANHVARGDTVNLANPCPSTCEGSDADDLGKLLAKLLLGGASGRVLSEAEIDAHRTATARKAAERSTWFNTRSVAFPTWVFLHLLSQPDAIGISSRFVRDRSGRDTLLLRAIDSQGRLFGDTMNLALPCPSTCDTTGG